MAEYVEVTMAHKRMCERFYKNSINCKGCELFEGLCSVPVREIEERDAKKAEALIMKWVAEHPEPVYPTWGEWLRSGGILASGEGLAKLDKLCMDPETAEKLGVLPKEA